VTKNKKGDDPYEIPYETSVAYDQPRSDCVPMASQVDLPQELLETAAIVETIEEAIDLYLDAHRRKFTGKHGLPRKTNRLKRFISYLEASDHSMKLADLTCEDGQRFIDSLVSARDGSNLSLHNRKRIRGALRSFSCFLAAAGLFEEDLFFDLRLKQANSHI
jgi:site-specific recombinase XerD